MKSLRFSKDSARALIEAALDADQVATVVADLRRAQETFRHSPTFVLDLEERSIPLARRQSVLQETFREDFHPFVLHALLMLQERSLLGDIQLFVDRVEEAARDMAKHYEVDVTSASRLTEDERRDLTEAIRKSLGGTVHLHERENADLLGGFQFRIGDQLVDASTKGALKRLHAAMISS